MKKTLISFMLIAIIASLSAFSAFAQGLSVCYVDITFSEEQLTVGEEATMTVKITSNDPEGFGVADMFYELENLEIVTMTAPSNGTFGDGNFNFYDFSADHAEIVFAFTVKATSVGTAKISFTEDSYAANTYGDECYDFEVIGNTITAVAPAPAGPTEVEIAASIEKLVGEVTEKQDYAYAADITVEGNPTQLIWSVLDGTRKYSVAQNVEGVSGNVKVGFVSEKDYDETTMGVLLTNAEKDTIWYSVKADLANQAE